MKIIRLSHHYNKILPTGIFPSSVQEIYYGSCFNKSLAVDTFPVGIQVIVFGAEFDQILPVGIFPHGVRTIQLSQRYSKPLKVGLFPSSARQLWISTDHWLPDGIFPEGLESIVFSPCFSQSLRPGIFPSTLRRLLFGQYDYFNNFLERGRGFQMDILPGTLPEFLCEIEVGPSFFGFLPLSALPPYFLPDSSHGEDFLLGLLKFPVGREYFSPMINRLISRIGENRQFRLIHCPAPFSSYSENLYFLAYPVDGLGEPFLAHKDLFQILH